MRGADDTTEVRQLVINADDFGFSEGINRGIMEAFYAGALRSTSVMVGMPAFADAVLRARAAGSSNGESLGIGLHFTLTVGKPLTRAPSLVDERTGDFLRIGSLVRRSLQRRIRTREVADECAAQIARAREAGIRLTHLDGHHHVHLLPGVREGVRSVVQAEDIPVVRRPREALVRVPLWQRRLPERALLRAFAREMTPASWGVRMTENFVGSTLLGARRFHHGLLRVLNDLPSGTTELMVHPGHVPEPLPGDDPYTTQRERELRALLSPDVLAKLHDGSIRLLRFDEL